MSRPKLCTNSECKKADAKHRIIYSSGLCRACYMRKWRKDRAPKPAEVTTPKLPSTPGAESVAEFLGQRVPERRRKLVRQLMDSGRDLDGVLEAIMANDEWRSLYIDPSPEPLVTLSGDVAFFEEQDSGKGRALCDTEALIRKIERRLAEPNLPATPAARLTKQLADAQLLRARLAREVHVTTGVGVLPADDDEFEDEEDNDDGRPPVEFDTEYHQLMVDWHKEETLEAARENCLTWVSEPYGGRNIANYGRSQLFADIAESQRVPKSA